MTVDREGCQGQWREKAVNENRGRRLSVTVEREGCQ